MAVSETSRTKPPAMRKELGKYVVVDPEICHGKPTFNGTRILVGVVLSQVASGMDWDAISEQWYNRVSKDAIAEAVRLAGRALLTYANEPEFQPEPLKP
jgi:uncharacterized protein (DUF433 family)